jgi:hypothetical protein
MTSQMKPIVFKKTCRPLYPNARCIVLGSTLLLMNVYTIHGLSNKFVDELLAFPHRHLLPKDNCLLASMYIVKTLTIKVGLDYRHIHACVNGCILFRWQYASLETCPKCGATWFKTYGKFHVVAKVLRHFPLAFQLF